MRIWAEINPALSHSWHVTATHKTTSENAPKLYETLNRRGWVSSELFEDMDPGSHDQAESEAAGTTTKTIPAGPRQPTKVNLFNSPTAFFGRAKGVCLGARHSRLTKFASSDWLRSPGRAEARQARFTASFLALPRVGVRVQAGK